MSTVSNNFNNLVLSIPGDFMTNSSMLMTPSRFWSKSSKLHGNEAFVFVSFPIEPYLWQHFFCLLCNYELCAQCKLIIFLQQEFNMFNFKSYWVYVRRICWPDNPLIYDTNIVMTFWFTSQLPLYCNLLLPF